MRMFGNLFGGDEDDPKEALRDHYAEQPSSTGMAPGSALPSLSADPDFFAVSVGGSVLVREGINTSFLEFFSQNVSRLHREGKKFALVCGGGAICRDYLAAARQIGKENYFLDQVGIAATRLNAALLVHAIPETYPQVLTSLDQSDAVLAMGKIPVYGGVLSGATSDFITALLAEKHAASFVNITNVDGVYTKDPKRSKKAELIPEMDHARLQKIAKVDSKKPGVHVVIDSFAAGVLARSNIPAFFVNGERYPDVESVFSGRAFTGTIVRD